MMRKSRRDTCSEVTVTTILFVLSRLVLSCVRLCVCPPGLGETRPPYWEEVALFIPGQGCDTQTALWRGGGYPYYYYYYYSTTSRYGGGCILVPPVQHSMLPVVQITWDAADEASNNTPNPGSRLQSEGLQSEEVVDRNQPLISSPARQDEILWLDYI